MTIKKSRTEGPKVQSGSLIFPLLLTLILGLALAQDAVLLCPEKTLDVMVTRTESEMSTNGTLILSCKGCSHFAHSSFLYWLGNRSFIEHLPGKLREDKTRRQRQNGVTWLQRDLVLEKLSPRLENTNFSCVLVDPAQVTQRHVLLAHLWVRMMGVPRWTKRWGRGGTLSTWGRMLSKGVCRGMCMLTQRPTESQVTKVEIHLHIWEQRKALLQ
ncbi:interleukin-18-binding protein isoform X1 [Notamacropus eugenii]|uniref:interleukin-18-binding protein isoform X1 n=1 Tax=Notamacropus eugenii TaxID=9315 RepID=UPI003B674CC3